jgi:1-aminocyclopropane-1-carboxylate deaminase/D-cysteine desulfhydrase-like pyridoxal-dependent ACC family enzyme
MQESGNPQLPIALFKQYPALAEKLPHVALAEFPTPVEKLDQLGSAIGLSDFYIKRDDLTGRVYGGNKVRKLEFLLGKALRTGASHVATVGFAGSNHALATAVYAHQLGLKSVSMLMPQLNARYVRRNLLASHYFKAELRHYKNKLTLAAGMMGVRCLQSRCEFIPGGGSSPLGIVGYVNAAFELRDQIAAGDMPAPDRIYVAMGSMGTSAGLMLGLRAAGLNCRVIPIRVIEENMASARGMLHLLQDSATLLHNADPAFPQLEFSEKDFTIRNDCLGPGYASFTEKSASAARLLEEKTGIPANGTYTAKAFSAIMADAAAGALDNQVVLFWNTFNSRDLTAFTESVDYHQLPRAFHRYFEEDVQPLDRA